MNYKIRVSEATDTELNTHSKRCIQKHTVWARKTMVDEPGDFAFAHPRGIDEITYAFENYVEMRQEGYIFHLDKIILNKN